ncbi:MAG: sensor histidine kinase [Ruminococcus sp.]|nr:sensor histidine kinase [Ruminococcus sp.]
MSFREYIKDRASLICITVAAWAMILFFFVSFKIRTDIIILFSIIYYTAAILRCIWDFLRRREFYNTLSESMKQLDKKYLLSEVMEEPDFAEGRIAYEALCEANRSMCENVAAYKKISAEFREYIEMWVHEVRLPVASMLLMSHNDGENGVKYGEQLRRIDTCIESVLYYSRSENAEKDYIIKPYELKRIFGSVAVKNREDILRRNITLSTEGLDKTVMTDSKWLEFILGQLLSNSMKYFAEEREPEIKVYAEENDNSIVLHFRDNGIGIPAADLPYIFDKSYTGENGHTHSRSTGMGLYIVKSLCERLGHSISASSVQNEYTDISVSFGKNDHVKPQ